MANRQLMQHSQKVQSMRAVLQKGEAELAKVLPKAMSAEAMLRYALTAAQMNPALLDCHPASVGLALMNAAALGLEPNGRDGHLVPYKGKCQFIPDYKGITKLIYREPRVEYVNAYAVREEDEFDYAEGTSRFLHYKMNVRLSEEDRGELIAAFAIVKLTGASEPNWRVMGEHQVLKRRNASPSFRFQGNDSIWVTWAEEMWAKTALKQLSKFAPIGEAAERAVRYDDAVEAGKRPTTLDEMGVGDPFEGEEPEAPPEPPKTRRRTQQKPTEEPLPDTAKPRSKAEGYRAAIEKCNNQDALFGLEQDLRSEDEFEGRDKLLELCSEKRADMLGLGPEPDEDEEPGKGDPAAFENSMQQLADAQSEKQVKMLQNKFPLMAQRGDVTNEEYKELNKAAKARCEELRGG